MKITRRQLRRLIESSISVQASEKATSVAITSRLLIGILESFEELGYAPHEVPMWEVVSAMSEKIDIDHSMYNVFLDAIDQLQANPLILARNDYFEAGSLINVLRQAVDNYSEYTDINEDLKRLSYASKEQGYTYGIDHIEKKNKAADDIIGHT